MIVTVQIAVLVKQVPVAEALSLGSDGRLQRDHLELEMNAFCRRAVAQGVALVREHGGFCTVFTLGPAPAAAVLREAVAWGADLGIHVTGPEFGGSDTLATARALATAIRGTGLYDLVLVGRNAVDADTGQVGPALAQYLDLPFLGAAHSLAIVDGTLRARLEHDDGWVVAEAALPAVVACAERLCPPCKAPEAARAVVPPERIVALGASDLGPGPWGQAGSATVVGSVRLLDVARAQVKLHGPIPVQVDQAVELLLLRRAFGPGADRATGAEGRVYDRRPGIGSPAETGLRQAGMPTSPVVAVVIEPARPQLAREMLGEAARLAGSIRGRVTAISCEPLTGEQAGSWGADELLHLSGGATQEDVASAIGDWCSTTSPWAILAPGTMWGREVAARVAVTLQAGLTGDVVELAVDGARLVAWKPAFGGRLVASITATSAVQMITVRPGTLAMLAARDREAVVTQLPFRARGRVRVLDSGRDDDLELLAKAPAVIGVGRGVAPERYPALRPLLRVLGAELAGTRRVTDRGWLPRSRQLGLTGLSIRPRLYVALGLSGKFNHMIGVRGAGCVLAINCDLDAPVFEAADIGIVGDWQEVVPQLVAKLTDAAGVATAPTPASSS